MTTRQYTEFLRYLIQPARPTCEEYPSSDESEYRYQEMGYGLIIIIIAVDTGAGTVSGDCLVDSLSAHRHNRSYRPSYPSYKTKTIVSCMKTCQRAGRRLQNELIFYCCCSHTIPTTADTRPNFPYRTKMS